MGTKEGMARLITMMAIVLPAVLVTAACDEARPPGLVSGTWISEREQRGDTLIVRTVTGSVWGDTMRLVAEVSIGVLDGPPSFVFGRVAGIDVDAQGRLVAVDAQAREVRIFSPTGEHLRTFGRSGDGPGEFRGPDQVRITSDGRIVVRDLSGARFAVFSPQGDYLGGWPRASGYATNAPFFLNALDRVVNPTLPGRLVSYGLDGTIHDTLPVPTRGYEPTRLELELEGGRASYSIPFMPDEEWTATRDGRILFGIGDRYALERWEGDARILRIERSVEPVPVAPAEAAQEREEMTRRIRRVNDPTWQWDGTEIPSTKPFFRAILAGLDGTVWLLREAASVEEPNPDWDPRRPDEGFPTRWRRPVVADVFDAEGRYLGPVTAPESLRWRFPDAIVSQDRVWAVTIHEDGYPQIVRYRVGPT